MSIRFLSSTALACTISAALATPSLAAPECKAFGVATYQATRTVDISGRAQIGTVYVSGDNERDETTAQGKAVVHIKSPTRVVSFDPIAKKGILAPPPSARREEPKADANTQVDRKSEGDTHTLVIRKKISDAWVQVYRSVCRKDGVLLERDFPVPGPDGKMLTAKMRHTAIEVKAIAAEMFVVPSDVAILEPPPKAKK